MQDNPTLICISGELIQTQLKRSLLLYDKIGLINLKMSLEFTRLYGQENTSFLNKNKVASINSTMIEMLADTGILYQVDTSQISIPELVADGNRKELEEYLDLIDNKVSESSKDIQGIQSFVHNIRNKGPIFSPQTQLKVTNNLNNILTSQEVIQSVLSRIFAPSLENIYDSKVHAIHTDFLKKKDPSQPSRDTILNVVLNKFPVINDDFPIERILDFRKETENRTYLAGLRTWINDAAKENVSTAEISDKLEWLLAEREAHLKREKIAYSYGSLGTVMVGTASFAEKLVKIKWSEMAKDLVKVFDQRAELLKAELEAPNRELHYVLKVRDEFET